MRSPKGFPWFDEDGAIQTWHWAGLSCAEVSLLSSVLRVL